MPSPQWRACRWMQCSLSRSGDTTSACSRPKGQPPPTPQAAAKTAVADHVADAGFAALHWACRENKVECVRQLLEAGAMVDVRATDDVTPFMLACKSGHYECAKLCQRAGADVEAANARGGTAMVVAVVATVTTAATAREAQRRADAAVLSRLREASSRRRRVPRTRAWR